MSNEADHVKVARLLQSFHTAYGRLDSSLESWDQVSDDHPSKKQMIAVCKEIIEVAHPLARGRRKQAEAFALFVPIRHSGPTEMSARKPRKLSMSSNWKRAGGDVVCDHCGLKYYDHPRDVHQESLTILCDGKRVKL